MTSNQETVTRSQMMAMKKDLQLEFDTRCNTISDALSSLQAKLKDAGGLARVGALEEKESQLRERQYGLQDDWRELGRRISALVDRMDDMERLGGEAVERLKSLEDDLDRDTGLVDRINGQAFESHAHEGRDGALFHLRCCHQRRQRGIP